jgi:hypothetical protein
MLLRMGTLLVALVLLLVIMYVAGQNRSGQPQVQTQRAESEVILYDQYNNVSLWGALSEDDSTNYGKDTSQAADDFTVPPGQTWIINQVEAAGIYLDPEDGKDDESVDITFFQGVGFMPGPEVSAQDDISYTTSPPDSVEAHIIPVPPTPSPQANVSFAARINPVTLSSGVYWLSVQVRKGSLDSLDWLWAERLVIDNHEALLRSKNMSCEPWVRLTNCFRTSSVDVPDRAFDLVFRLKGNILGESRAATETTTYALPSATPTSSPTQTEPASTAIPIPPSHTSTPTNLPTRTPEDIPTDTVIATSVATATLTSEPTSQPSATATGTPTSQSTSTPTVTATSTPSTTATLAPTSTPTIELTGTPTVLSKAKLTPVRPTNTATATATATQPVPHKQPPPQP